MNHDPELDKPLPKEITDAANLVTEYFEMRGVERWEFRGICSRNHAPPYEKQAIAEAYRMMISDLTEHVCMRRVEEIEGRVVSIDEVREHGEMQVTEVSGIALYVWKGQPICEFTPPGFTLTGWRNGSVKELRPVSTPFVL